MPTSPLTYSDHPSQGWVPGQGDDSFHEEDLPMPLATVDNGAIPGDRNRVGVFLFCFILFFGIFSGDRKQQNLLFSGNCYLD